MPRDFSPYPGKWTLIQVMKEPIEANGGEMPLRRGLKNLGVEVIGGKVRLR